MEDIKQSIPRKALAAGKDAVRLELVLSQIKMAGYQTDICDSADSALKKMASIPYSLVTLDEDMTKMNGRFLAYMSNIPMHVRRKALYVLISPRYQTMDKATAFAMGMDGLINYKDLNRLASCINILKKDHRQLYREFLNFTE